MSHRVLVDANVWYSRTLRDWVLMLELEQAPFKTYWTEDIVAETIYHLRRDHPKWDGGEIANVRRKITGSVEGGCVEDFVVDGSSPWTDRNDQHVHAAALACSAGYVLTADKGFTNPDVDLDALDYEVYRPDAFFELVDDSAPAVVRGVIAKQVAYAIRRRGTADLCSRLRHAGCPGFAERVREHLQSMDLQLSPATRPAAPSAATSR